MGYSHTHQKRERFRKCFICEERKMSSLHHIKSRLNGGDSSKRNLIPLCHDCHNKAEGKEWIEILELRRQYRDLRLPPPSPSIKPNIELKKGESLHWCTTDNAWKVWGTDKYGLYAIRIDKDLFVDRSYVFND